MNTRRKKFYCLVTNFSSKQFLKKATGTGHTGQLHHVRQIHCGRVSSRQGCNAGGGRAKREPAVTLPVPIPSTSFFVNSRTLTGCTLQQKGGRRTPSVSSRISSKLPLPLHADVRLHIPMTHRNDVGTDSQKTSSVHLKVREVCLDHHQLK